MFDDRRFDEAEYLLWEVLRTSPRAPATTYLLGLTMLFNGRIPEGKRLIDRAYELRHWIDDRIMSPGVFEMLDAAESEFPDWEWLPYQRMREQWRSVGLNVQSAADHLAGRLKRQLAFVQIGANDGRSGDPLSNVIRRHGMRGLFVEPQAEPFERLQKRYAAFPDLHFAQVAITEHDGAVTLFTDPTRTTLGTLLPDRNIMRGRQGSTVEVTVDGRTFGSLAADYELGDFDLLQLDTEGFDQKILSQVPLDDHHVSIVNMEYYCLPVAERLAAGRQLEEAGFALQFGVMDLLAVRVDTFADRFCISKLGC